MDLRPMLVAVFGLVAPLAGGTSLPADSRGIDPCRVMPFDGTTENGFGAAPGFAVEYCSDLPQPPSGCTMEAYYFMAFFVELTRLDGASDIVPFLATQRGGTAGQSPGPIRDGPYPAQATGVPVFPATSTFEVRQRNPFTYRLDPATGVFGCVTLDGGTNADQYVAADQTPSTPLRNCWGSTDGLPFESCQIFVPALRALKIGGLPSQFAAFGTDDQVVPPSTSKRWLWARANATDSRAMEVLVAGQHDAPNPLALRIRRGQEGANGPIVATFPSPASPFQHQLTLSLADWDRLLDNRLYLEVANAANPNGAARGQLTPANWIFGDGAETGDFSRWSAVQR